MVESGVNLDKIFIFRWKGQDMTFFLSKIDTYLFQALPNYFFS